MRRVELYLHGLKWKNHEVSEQAFKNGLVDLWAFIDSEESTIRGEHAVFRIRECFHMTTEPIRHPHSKSPNGRGFDITGIPIDRIEPRDSRMTGMFETLYVWYRANCDDPSFYVDEQSNLAFREVDGMSEVKRFFPAVPNEPEIKSKLVPLNQATIFDIIDLE